MSDLDLLAWIFLAPYLVIAALFLAAWHEAIKGREELEAGQ